MKSREAATYGSIILALAVCQYWIFFYDLPHFFQGDTIYWLYYRATTFGEFLKGFVSLDLSGWYRPLGNRLLPSVLFPFFGFNPVGYHVVLFVLMATNSAIVFLVSKEIAQKVFPAVCAVFLWGTHPINSAPTYDVAFAAEQMYCLFYLLAILTYLISRKTSRQRYLWISAACFLCSLWSKESAVTLPFTLAAFGLILEPSMEGAKRTLQSVRWHLLALSVYVVLVLGYLGAARFILDGFWKRLPSKANYQAALDFSVLQNLGTALKWVFYFAEATSAKWLLLAFSATIVAGAIAVMLDSRRRRPFLMGASMFLIALFPALTLAKHFFPYYLFLPMVGLSIAIGAVFDYFRSPGGAPFLLFSTVPLGVFILVGAIQVRSDIPQNPLLGLSAKTAASSLKDFGRLAETLPDGSLVYVINDDHPTLNWDTAGGNLFKLYYKREDLKFLYSSGGVTLPRWSDVPVAAVRWDGARFFDVHDETALLAKYTSPYIDGFDSLQIDRTVVVAGRDSYKLAIKVVRDSNVWIQYQFNEEPVTFLKTYLDSNGESTVFVPKDTPKGAYHFVAFGVPRASTVYRVNATITVQ